MQVRVTDANNFAEGEMRVFDIAGTKVSVAASGGRLFAIDDTCTHRGCSLGKGELEGSTVTCPCHGSQFDVTTGAVIRGPALQPVRSWSVKGDGPDLLVAL
jgi:nitrite reductase/ring-hydroxylating ferredoxin subunit